jgi:short-subunit dehydrogenase/uncharacterized tellurite resistance protein B-like protein
MFAGFRKFLSEVSEGDKHPAHFAHDDYRLAAVALLVHAAAIDGDVTDAEREKLHAVIKQQFALDEATTDELVAEATEAEHEAIDLYHFTSLINRSLDGEGRRRVVEMMWEIAYADGDVDEFERNLIWRAADLLGCLVPGTHRARSTRGGPAGDAVTQEKRPITLITGASAGIGAALAHEFAAHGHELVLVARREQALGVLADAIAAKGANRPTVLRADLARADAVQEIAEALDQRGLEPDVVVNNAGFGLLGAADELDRAEQLAMIDLDVRALTDLSLAFIDSLKRRRGGILNVASIAAFLPGPGMAVYYASKAYVLSFSEALHRELKPKGVRVTVLCPGPVPTEFQARAGMSGDAFPRLLTRSAERVARDAYRGLMQGRRVVVPGSANRVVATMIRLTPHRILLELIARQQRGRR